MNLDELQIKISIELDDLNKQLKSITKGIDEALGPKATKKLMADNNKVIKSGLTSINKTTLNLVKKSRKDTTKEVEAMSKDINKSLNKAFDINLTKFNSNITSAMNQARQTVRSACNDIRRELNAALNIQGNIRVTSKTTVSGSATGSSGSNVASNMASSQYIGAMIIKSTNAVIANNNANTTRLEQAINNLGSKLTSAIKSVNKTTTKAGSNDTTHRPKEVAKSEPRVVKRPTDDNVVPFKRVEDPLKDIAKVMAKSMQSFEFELGKAGKAISAITKDMVNAHKAFVVINRNLSALNGLRNIKQLGAGSNAYGHNSMQSGTVNWRQGRKEQTIPSFKGEVIDKETIPNEAFKQLQDIIEVVGKECIDIADIIAIIEKRIISAKKAIAPGFSLGEEGSQSLRGKVIDKAKHGFTKEIGVKEVIEGTFRDITDEVEQFADEIKKTATVIRKATGAMPGSKKNPIVDTKKQEPSYVYTDKELPNNVFEGAINSGTDAVEEIQATMQKIKNIWANAQNMDLAQDIIDAIDVVSFLINPINEGLSQVGRIILQELLGTVGPSPLGIKSLPNNTKKISSSAKDKEEEIELDVDTTKAEHNLNNLKKLTSDLSKITPDLDAENGMEDYHRKQMSTILDANAKEVGAFTSKTDLSKLKDMMTQLQKLSEELESDLTELFHDVDAQYLEESLLSVKDVIKSFMPRLKEVVETLNGLDEERIKLNIDTTDAQRQIEALKASYEMLIEQCKAAYKANNANILRDIIPQIGGPVDSGNKRQYPTKPNLKRRDSDKPSKPGKPPKPTIMGFGFGAYKNEIDALIEHAKKAGTKIKKALFGKSGNGSNELAMTIDTDGDFSQAFDALNGSIDKLITAIENLNENIELLTRQMKQSMNISSLFGGKGKNPIQKTVESIGKEIRKTIKSIKKSIVSSLVKSFLSKKFGKNNDTSLLKSFFGKKNKKEEKDSPIKSMLKAAFPNSYDLVKNLFPELRETAKKAFADAGFDDALREALSSVNFGEVAEKLKAIWREGMSDDGDIPKEWTDDDYERFNKFQEEQIKARFEAEREQGGLNYSEIEEFNAKEIEKRYKTNEADLSEVDAVNDRLGSALNKLTGNLKEATEKIEQQQESVKNKVNKVGQVFPGSLKNSSSPDDELAMTIDTGDANKLIEKAKKIGERIKNALFNSDSQVLGFAPYQNELHELGQLAKKVGKKIKQALSSAFTNIKTGKLHINVSNILNKTKGSVSRFSGKIKTALSNAFSGIKSNKLYTSVVSGLNKAKGAVSKFAGKVKPILNKAFTGIKVGAKVTEDILKGLGKALKALKDFAGKCKTIWGKIKQIFHKGASDSVKATGKLKTGLKDLLSQISGLVSLYGLYNLGKQAVQESQTLAQSEIKLASLMQQRMGATKETIEAIRQMAEEHAKLGVVSETAMKKGAEQLAMYVHSAKALKDLMPAIANLTAKRGGFNATPEDAEEIATQLGEAIREGTTTPLEQSGIYLSEAEIDKFAHLTTEEERAAYLADVIAKNVGNINQALANTPHGAIAQLKNNFKSLLGTLGIFLANVIKPIVQWLNVIVVACNKALKALGKLLGFDMTGGANTIADMNVGGGSTSTPVDTGSTEIDTGGVDNVKDAYDGAADAADKATEANEKFKGSLMGFDEINVLSDNTNKNKKDDFDPTDITPGEGGQLTPLPEVGELTEGESIFGKFGDKIKAFMDEIIEPFKNAWALLGDRWKAEWADLVESFKHFCDSLGKFLVSVWEHGKHFSAVVKPRKIGRTLIIIKTHILDTKEMISCKKYGKISKDMKDFIKYLIWVK